MIRFLLGGRRLALTLLVVMTTVAFCGLGVWQVSRLDQRLADIAQAELRLAAAPVALAAGQPLDPDQLYYRRVELRGSFDASQEILRRNRSINGLTGFHIVTPFRLSGSQQAVMVDRGWIPYDEATVEQRAVFAPPAGELTIIGVVVKSQEADAPPYDPPVAPGQRLDAWFRINIPRIQQQVNTPLLPVFVEQQWQPSDPTTPPIRGESVPPDAGNHMSYAIQWFSFAIILLGGYAAITYQQWLRLREGEPAAPGGAFAVQGE
ncbi:MAG: SURF1 family protein [Roseiflexaceae bacterium]|nr:SURF1 family protein [Roseiflexaceae bacterium]